MEPTADIVVFIIFPAPFPRRLIPPLDRLIRIKLYLIYQLHDFLVIMGEFPDPALHLRNKISDTHHQSSHCPRKLRDHTKHHQYDHANRKYDRKEQTYRSCQFCTYLIFFLPFQKFSFPKSSLARWSQMRSLRQVQKVRFPIFLSAHRAPHQTSTGQPQEML